LYSLHFAIENQNVNAVV